MRSDYLPGAGQLCHECAIKNAVCDGITLILGFLFTLVAAPVIHLSGLDNVDSCPTPEDIEKSQRLAESLKRERTK